MGYRDHVRWDYDVTLPGLFADAGYHTQAVGKMHVSPARNLLGFHNVVLHDGYLHCERKPGADPDSVEGKSLAPFCRGEKPEWREYVHGEHCLGELSNHWLTDGKLKYAWYSQTGREQLFDIAADPYETRDLSGERPDEVAAWRARLVTELTGREEGYVEGSKLVTGRKPQATLAEAGLPT